MINFAVGPVMMDEEIRSLGPRRFRTSALRNFPP